MSLETLKIINGHRKEAVENSPSSEEFSIVGGSLTFRGIFDKFAIDESEDKSNVTEKNIHAYIMVDSVPSGLVERTSKITREGQSTPEYIFSFYDVDDEGQGLVWLG